MWKLEKQRLSELLLEEEESVEESRPVHCSAADAAAADATVHENTHAHTHEHAEDENPTHTLNQSLRKLIVAMMTTTVIYSVAVMDHRPVKRGISVG